jgi:predicted ATPase with chaperone activity
MRRKDIMSAGASHFIRTDSNEAAQPPEGTPGSVVSKVDIKGHHVAKRALEIAATGDHSILLFGPHGSGKATLIATYPEAMNAIQRDSCVCGNHLHPTKMCSCHPRVLSRWTRRISRLADECDMVIEVSPVPVKEWHARPDPSYVEAFAHRVAAAREFGKSHLSIDLADDSAYRTFEMASRRLGLSVGSGQRILRVARTIANFDASSVLKAKHIAEVVQYKVVRGLTHK